MELFNNLIFGFSVALSLQNLLYCFIGVSVGTLIGVLPGIGPLATIAMLLPITFNVAPVGALIMLAGIYYGAQYGGSTTAILVNLPGETSAVVTCIDGYQMARQGRAGPALAIAAIGSFFAGTVGTLLIALAGPPLAEMALKFGAPEYFSLMLMGLVAAAVLAQGDMIKSLAMVAMGLLLGIVGTDVNTGMQRFTLRHHRADRRHRLHRGRGRRVRGRRDRRQPRRPGGARGLHRQGDEPDADLGGPQAVRRRRSCAAPRSARSSACCPAPGRRSRRSRPTWSRRSSPRTRRASARARSRASPGPEAANNADAQCKFIPMLTLGLPASGVMALMLGALTIQGIQPGPQVMTQRPELFWGLIASMWIGNAMLVVLNLPLIGLWVKLLQGALSPAVPGDHGVLGDRHLQREQLVVRDLPHRAVRRASASSG